MVLNIYILFCKQEHTGRVFRLQFDEFQIVSSSHDDTILIWDFLNCNMSDNSTVGAAPPVINSSNNNQSDTRSPSRKFYLFLNYHVVLYLLISLFIFLAFE